MSKRITDSAIKSFLSSSDKVWLYDSRRVEFRANPRRTGGTFYDVKYVGHSRKRTVLGKWPAVKAVDLFRRVSEIRGQLMAGERTGVALDTVKTCSELFVWFVGHIESDKTFSESYIETASGRIHNHLIGAFEGFGVRELSRNLVYRRLYKVKMGVLSLSTIRATWGILKRACSLAAKLGVIALDPLAGVSWRDFSSSKHKPASGRLKVHDLDVIAVEIRKSQLLRRLFFSLQLCHGTRISETCLAEWRHFSLETRVWYIPGENTKNGNEHKVPLSLEMVELLNEVRRSVRGRYLFSRDGIKPLTRSAVSVWYKDLRMRAGVHFTSHDFRKLARDFWQINGIDSDVAEMLLNHSRGDLKGRYTSKYAWPLMVQAVEMLVKEVFNGYSHGVDSSIKRKN